VSSGAHPINKLLDLLGRRWALRVLWELRSGPLPYGVLRGRCDDVSTSTLASRLGDLERAGIIERTGDGWALTEAGTDLGRLLLGMNAWARRHGSA
jgi:DNA-binding HxlR family transcriptional regulator